MQRRRPVDLHCYPPTNVVGGRVRLALDYDGWETCGTDAPVILATLARLERKRM